MKTMMKGAALFLALSAIPFAASAQDWQGHGRGQQQQPFSSSGNNGNGENSSSGNSNSSGNGSQNDWRGSRGHNDRGWAWGNRGNNGNPSNGNAGNAGNGNSSRGWGDRGNWQHGGDGYAQRPPMPPPQQVNNYYGRGGDGYRRYDRDRDYRYAPPPRTYYPPNYGRRYYSVGYGYRPEPVWTVGNVYYGDDYAPTYAVDDYGDYGLYDPPRGYGWRRDDFGHYLLVAITSGIIADLLFGH